MPKPDYREMADKLFGYFHRQQQSSPNDHWRLGRESAIEWRELLERATSGSDDGKEFAGRVNSQSTLESSAWTELKHWIERWANEARPSPIE